MNYQVAMYDPKPLQEAKTLLQASMNTFDDPENQERMQQEMEEVRARAAEEAVAMARFWEHKGKPAAAAIYHELLLRNYPDTPVAEESKEFLSKLDPKYRQPDPQAAAQVPGAAPAPGQPLAPDNGHHAMGAPAGPEASRAAPASAQI